MSQSEDLPRERQDLKYQQEEAQKSARQVEKLTDEVYQLKTQNQVILREIQDKDQQIQLMTDRIQEIETAATPEEEVEEDKKVVKKVKFGKETSVYISQDFEAKLQEKDDVIRELEG